VSVRRGRISAAFPSATTCISWMLDAAYWLISSNHKMTGCGSNIRKLRFEFCARRWSQRTRRTQKPPLGGFDAQAGL